MTATAQAGVCNVPNRTIFEGDNLDVMRGMNDGCVDLIYLDPPFNSNRDYAVPIGSKAAGAAFKVSVTQGETLSYAEPAGLRHTIQPNML